MHTVEENNRNTLCTVFFTTLMYACVYSGKLIFFFTFIYILYIFGRTQFWCGEDCFVKMTSVIYYFFKLKIASSMVILIHII